MIIVIRRLYIIISSMFFLLILLVICCWIIMTPVIRYRLHCTAVGMVILSSPSLYFAVAVPYVAVPSLQLYCLLQLYRCCTFAVALPLLQLYRCCTIAVAIPLLQLYRCCPNAVTIYRTSLLDVISLSSSYPGVGNAVTPWFGETLLSSREAAKSSPMCEFFSSVVTSLFP